jgi:hypothetical protein
MEKIMKKTLLIGLILLSQGLMASTAPTSKPKMQSQELSFLSLNPKYAIEITNLPQIIGSWALTEYASMMHLWVHLRYAANTHEPSISRIFGNSIA